MDLGLTGKVALVTGGASGMGRATVQLLAREGARVVVADIDGDGAERAAAALRESGGEAIAVAGDVALRRDAERYVAAAVDRFGRLDIVVNDAGLEALYGLADTTDEVWDSMFGVNVKGPYMVLQAALPHLIAAGGGSIVNVASAAGLHGNPGLAAYSAAKAALMLLTRCLARELGHHNIRANAVAPGLFDTPTGRRWIDTIGGMDAALKLVGGTMALRRAGQPEEVANAVVFLASDAASYITGVVLPVDAGMSS